MRRNHKKIVKQDQRQLWQWNLDLLNNLANDPKVAGEITLLKNLVRAVEARLKTSELGELAETVNQIPTRRVKSVLVVDRMGLRIEFSSFQLEEGAKKYSPDIQLCLNVTEAMDRLKGLLGNPSTSPYVGICQLSTCGRLFIRKRKDEKFCKPAHRKTFWARKSN